MKKWLYSKWDNIDNFFVIVILSLLLPLILDILGFMSMGLEYVIIAFFGSAFVSAFWITLKEK